MIGAMVDVLRPVLEPLFALRFAPPHLPERDSAIRTLAPCPGYLRYRYAAALLGALAPLLYAGGLATLAIVTLGRAGIFVGCILAALAVAGVLLLLVGARLDYELTTYLIGARSLRVRSGAFVTREITLSFANIQKIELSQGPLERAFGFARLTLSTAGGGDAKEDGGHRAVLAGLQDAEALRLELSERVRGLTGSGLGERPSEKAREEVLPRAELELVLRAASALRRAAERRATEKVGSLP